MIEGLLTLVALGLLVVCVIGFIALVVSGIRRNTPDEEYKSPHADYMEKMINERKGKE